ncbi:unnamed protein product (macronuclear) [Paramecium tetraurelia]|uniref:Uncharacterized protein n=1 Tax=Paramecium tetraurelia TaxID=5888 RepID=A0C8Z7_PARTE|nr:uncharacterized protein GSPATT00006570001 [Paramecium tetraurelia]CAK67264.1 unnamed protein product [Paramecium tetraurelia]|eukprot:XP_001434661.1 hypothetical protein (macronuclear) [Paramecium tetraurelia strain d4-2]
MSEEHVEQRPETSKCSRLDKRRMISQNSQRNRTAIQSRTAQNFNPNSYNGMTLEEYFRNKVQENVNAQVDKKKKFLVTSNEFFKEFQNQDVMRRTYMGDSKYMNMKQDMKKKTQDYDKDLFQKYANKFDLGNGFGK